MDLMFFLLLGHFCGDYALQSDYIATRKKNSKSVLALHSAIYTATIWATIFIHSLLYGSGLAFSVTTLIFIAALFIQHWLQDFYKGRNVEHSKQLYYVDQALHLVVLYIYRIFLAG